MRTDRTERLLNLVLCLLDAGRAVPRSAIRDAVPGYADSASDEAFERMFERDKDELRAMGIPVETVFSANGDVDGYRIPADEYSMPAVSFTATELAVLGLAAQAWRDAVVSGAAQGALRKIEAVSGRSTVTADVGVSLAARPGAGEQYLPMIWEGIRARRALSFGYRGLRDERAAERTVEPWGTARYRGAWYLAGLDRDRQDTRVFRLSRVLDAVRFASPAGGIASAGHEDVRAIIERMAEAEPTAIAEVEVDSGGTRLRLRAESIVSGVLRIPYADEAQLVSDVAELGASARVIAPSDVRDRVVESLSAVLQAHEGSP